MKINYFCTHWGNQLPFPKFCRNVVNAGYNGIEMDLPLVKKKRNEIVETLADHGLLLIGQYWQSLEKDFSLNEKNFKKHLYNLAEVNPVMINTQTGKDYFSFSQNMQLVNAAKTISAETGVEIVHETHRGKFLFNLQVFEAAAKAGLRNTVGTLAMARTNNPHSATAQFFINVKDNEFLDHRAPSGQGWGYVAFGKVISGMEVVTRIRQMPTGPGGPFPTDAPLNQVIIQSATLVK